LSLEKLATAANIGIEELLRIEDDTTYSPDPATVCRLAQILELPASQLLALSGNTSDKDEKVYQAALKFAARIREADELNSHQTKALHDFVQALTKAA
jgi:HTH-type transcriptional regulator, competence development regulator